MLEETYFKFTKNILLKMKKMQPNFQEPVVEYFEPDQVIDIWSYNNHYPVLDKSNERQEQHNDDNDIYDTSELEHEFEYRIYEDVFKTEQLMAELKRIDEAEKENKKLTLFPPKTNIFVHSKNCTFSKKGLGHKGRCYSVCNDDTCK